MTDNEFRNIHTSGGSYREVRNTGTYVEGDYYSSPEAKRCIISTASEIQQLLEQLEKNYSLHTSTGKMQIATGAIQHITANPDFKGRVVSAIKAGGVGALDAALNHPASSFLIEAIKDWTTHNP